MILPRNTYTPSKNERPRVGRHPARCNRRDCQARRTLSKNPKLYARWPKCHIAGCDGLMYVDWTRKKKAPSDNPPVCDDPCCPYMHRNQKGDRPMHRVNTQGCIGYEDWIIDRSLGPRSKHSPIKDDDDEVPF